MSRAKRSRLRAERRRAVGEAKPAPEREPERAEPWWDLPEALKLLGYGLIALATAALLVVTSVGALQNIGPAWAAHEGHGMRGTFFAVVQHCSKNCWWTGTFSPNAPVNARPGVTLASGADVSGVGAAVAAIDSGAPGTVYPAGGGTEWLMSSVGVVLCSLGVLTWLAVFVLLPLRHLRQFVDRLRTTLALTAAPGHADSA